VVAKSDDHMEYLMSKKPLFTWGIYLGFICVALVVATYVIFSTTDIHIDPLHVNPVFESTPDMLVIPAHWDMLDELAFSMYSVLNTKHSVLTSDEDFKERVKTAYKMAFQFIEHMEAERKPYIEREGQ
jgi:hypothetical protein